MTEVPRGVARDILQRCADGVLMVDNGGRILFWNGALERLWGLRAADVVGAVATAVLPFLGDGQAGSAVRSALAGETTRLTETPFTVTATQRRGFFDADFAPLFDEGRTLVGAFVMVRDSTESQRTRHALAEVETRFRNMADAAPVLLWMSGTDGLCTFFNQTWLRFTGRTLEQEWGIGWASGVHHEDFAACMETYRAGFAERRTFEMEYRLRRADGEYRWILDRGSPRYLPDGSFAGFIGSCVDISARKDLEADLRRAVILRDEFLSVASHELRTPLTSLQLQLDRVALALGPPRGPAITDRAADSTTQPAQRDQPGPPQNDPPRDPSKDQKVRAALQAASRQGERLTQLIDNLLDVSRMSNGRLDVRPAPCDLSAVVGDTVERWRAPAAAAGVDLQVAVAPNVRGVWDRVRLEQVLDNLLSNAVKYGPDKPVAVALDRVDQDTGSPVARIRVRDQGLGIPERDLERIFQRFARAVSTRNYGGLGLGLWIAREIVTAHQGLIRAVSDHDTGATFEVTLPIVSARQGRDEETTRRARDDR